jgi:mRNA-degrading endonuclease RelE of RelBE toxin-antitoxin system
MTRAYRLAYADSCRRQILRLPPALKPIAQRAIEQVAQNPHAGKRLERELVGYLPLRAKRYRVICGVDETSHIVEIYYVGHRRDTYEVFAETIRQR